MLTSEWVRARRRGDELRLSELKGELKKRALEIATRYVKVMRDAPGKSRAEIDAMMQEVVVAPRELKIAGGLRKLIEDRSQYAVEAGVDAPTLRREVFERSAEARRELAPGESFDRAGLLMDLAEARGATPEALERQLYADLKDAHRLMEYIPASAEDLVAQYQLGQAQAVLLKALRVRLEIHCATPQAYRRFFRKLKFHRLLYRIARREGGGYTIDIDGPFSLFRASTKYGLKLALLLPEIRTCEEWKLEADIRWGKDRRQLVFRQAGSAPSGATASSLGDEELDRPEEIQRLVERWRKRDEGWDVDWATGVFTLPGIGECVADLRFHHRASGFVVHLEVLGYWSREAVFKRVELVESGLPDALLFAASSRLRVSEELLPADHSSALYVYKGSLDRKAILMRLAAMREAKEKAK